MTTLNIDIENVNGVDLIKLDGLLNADTSPKLEEKLIALSEQETPNILLDMEKLSYISSAGIGCFIGVIKRIRNANGDLRFACVDPKVKRVFLLLDMGDFFQFFDGVEKGIASFSI